MIWAVAMGLVLGAFGVSVCLTTLVRRWSLRTDFVARPVADRYHRTVVPLGGGIAIYATLMLFLAAAACGIQFVLVPGHFGSLAAAAGVDPADFAAKAGQLAIVMAVATALFEVSGAVRTAKASCRPVTELS